MGSLMPGWDSHRAAKEGRKQQGEHSTEQGTRLPRNYLGRHSAPVGSLPQPQSSNQPASNRKDIDQGSHTRSGAMWDQARQAVGKGNIGEKSKWWQMFESASYNEPFEERPAHWKSGSYKPQFDVAKKAVETGEAAL